MSVRDFKATEDGEWFTGNGDFSTVADAEAVPQGIRVRLRMFFADCWLDEAAGVPYLESVLIKGADPLLVRELLREAIADTPDVTDVIGSELQMDGRDASVRFEVATTFSASQTVGGTVGV